MIRGFVLAMLIGVILGTWSTLYVAKNNVLFRGLDRSDKPKSQPDHASRIATRDPGPGPFWASRLPISQFSHSN